MDLLLSSLLFTILVAFLVLKLLSKPKNHPPGPWRLPIIGNLHQLLGPDLPYHRLRDLANKHGPLMFLQLGQVPHVVVSSPEVAKQVMKTHDVVFAQRPFVIAAEVLFYNCQDIGFAPYGDYWRQMRKICAQELLTPARVQSYRPIREERVSNLASTIIKQCHLSIGSSPPSSNSTVNLSTMLFSLSYDIISRAAFGRIPKVQESSFQEVVEGISKVLGGFCVADHFPSVPFLQVATGLRSKLQKLHQEADEILENIISEHRERKKIMRKNDEDDLVDVLLNLQNRVDPPLPDNSIKAVVLDILGAADTTFATSEWAMSELLKNPRIMEKAQAEVRRVFDGQGKVTDDKVHELDYLKLVIKETLRLHPPGPLLIPRESSEACEINGYRVAAKTRVIVNVWAIGRDPDYWNEAERFHPERFLDKEIAYSGCHYEYLPFGGGRRKCPGILFSIANLELSLASLLYHFDWKLPDGMERLDMAESFGVAAKRKSALELVPLLRRPLPIA